MKFKGLFILVALVLACALAFTGCNSDSGNGSQCNSHVDKNDDGKCDVSGCGKDFTDGCDAAHKDANDDGKCDIGGEAFTDGCDATHIDANDDGKCDFGGETFTDGCDATHIDANDDGKCDFGGEAFTDGCDAKDCLDTDEDGKCDNEGCDKATENKPAPAKITLTVTVKDNNGNPVTGIKVQICKEGENCRKPVLVDENGAVSFSVDAGTYYASFPTIPEGYTETDEDGKYYFGDNTSITVVLTAQAPAPTPCEHVDADDNGKCDECDEVFSDGCDADHRDVNDDGKCDLGGEDFTDGCDATHIDANDDGKCDFGGETFTDGCDTKDCLDTDEDGKCNNSGCDKATENKPAPAPCNHKDANDDNRCDECYDFYVDGCDTKECLDLDYDGKCDNSGCDKATENTPVDDYDPVVVVSKYFPSEISSLLYTEFEKRADGFKELNTNYAPFCYTDVYTITDCRLLSITIPVMKTLEPVDGKFFFTMHKFDSSFEGISSGLIESYTIVIDAVEHGLEAAALDDIYKVITVDLSDYAIDIYENESIAFCDESDTLFPAYLKADKTNEFSLSTPFKTLFPQATGAFRFVGAAYALDQITLCIDLELERFYEDGFVYRESLSEETEYRRMLEELKKLYAGKKFSVIGDSISTFEGFSNDASANVTTENNKVYYPGFDPYLYSQEYTYWGRLLRDLDLSLCVNNSWSGATVYGDEPNNADLDRLPLRANELDNDNGTPNDPTDDINPDVIVMYLGINDVAKGSPFGDLYDILTSKSSLSVEERMSNWAAEVQGNAGLSYDKKGESYTTFEQAYFLGLVTMLEKYPDAEIYCLTLLPNNDPRCTVELVEKFNVCISAIVNYLAIEYDITLVDQNGEYSEFTADNIHAFTSVYDNNSVHPNSRGHELIERLIIKTMFEKHGIQ